MTNEIKIGEITFVPDTHCVDADTGLDVWSFSPGLVREMLAESDKEACNECGGNGAAQDHEDDCSQAASDLTEIRKQRDQLISTIADHVTARGKYMQQRDRLLAALNSARESLALEGYEGSLTMQEIDDAIASVKGGAA